MWLFASYEVELSQPILIKSDSADPVAAMISLKDWDAELALFPSPRSGRIKQPGDEVWYYPVSRLDITVMRDGELGDELVHEEAAKAMIERLLVFLRLKKSDSLFQAIEKHNRIFTVTGEDAGDAGAGQLEKIDLRLTLARGYTQQGMRDYMGEYFSKELSRSLLHDAGVSVARHRSRRACLELTMACESALGMRLESIAEVKASIGSVFINQHSQEYEDIVELFRVRGALKRGSGGLFKFVSAARKRQIQRNLTAWQGAVECLVNWVEVTDKSLQGAL